uniref:Uncharacterized protein n=1 Tax=Denticeps clupeoides TaxID=299321 RepID=A0AAY4DH77_9TELE
NNNPQTFTSTMSSTSKKHQSFTSEPMRGKPATALPGIGKVQGARLESSGYSHATDLLGKYLNMQESRGQFQSWLKDTSGANVKQQNDCYNGLKEWSDNNL